MRLLAITLASSITLVASHTYAQAPAGQAPAPATQKPPAPATQKPPAPAPATPAAPATQKPAAPAPPPPKFQDGFKYAYVNMAAIAAQSNDGKSAAEKLKAFQDQKTRELQDKQKTLQAAQQKLESGGSVLSDAARTQLQSDIDRQQRDLQRQTEDAQQDVQNMAQQVEEDFTRRVLPIISKVAQDKQVHFVFNAQQSGLIWAEPGMDLTGEVIAAMNGGKPAAAPTPPAPSK
ncbi:MAG TPA: OmpH family outer membrane protein [Vicinamibacterales bacterium]|jgi:outer membrane protein|nr:OmpH family outer membrane protein [Vicinamibacterales bacterium]